MGGRAVTSTARRARQELGPLAWKLTVGAGGGLPHTITNHAEPWTLAAVPRRALKAKQVEIEEKRSQLQQRQCMMLDSMGSKHVSRGAVCWPVAEAWAAAAGATCRLGRRSPREERCGGACSSSYDSAVHPLQGPLSAAHYRDELAVVEALQDAVDPSRKKGASMEEVLTITSQQVCVYVWGGVAHPGIRHR